MGIHPDRLIQRLFGRTLPAAILALVLTGYACISLFSLMVQHRTAAISADPYTYLQFAQTLADGSFQVQGPLAEAVREFHVIPAEGEKAARPGPVWNTNVLPDGRTVYTVAMGYPLFLSNMLRFGGTWLYTHANLILLGFLLFLLFFCVWEGLDRDLFGVIAAGMACILLIRSHPPSFLQFSHPWREPLFYCCILGGVASLQVFNRKPRLWLVPAAGFLLGYACAIKEPNAIYGMVIGVYFLLTSGFRGSQHKVRLVLLFGLCGVLGASPILFQNWVASGNPFRSLQVARATANLMTPGGGSGLSPAHIGETVSRYVTLYRDYAMFWWPCMLVVLLGAVSAWRRPFIRMCIGLIIVHLALYLQWGNADFRHMYFGHIPYVILLAVGLVWCCRQLARNINALQRFEYGMTLLPLLLLALWPSPWKAVSADERAFAYREGAALIQKLGQELPEKPLLLSNRTLRDVIGIYSRLPVVRLHDLAGIHPEGDVKAVLEWLRDRGHTVVFLDNTDQDPQNVDRVDWSIEDQETLYEFYDLNPAWQLNREEWSLAGLTDKPELTAYEVEPWTRTRVERDLDIPTEGVAFLHRNPRAMRDSLQVTLNGTPVDDDPGLRDFIPLHTLDLGGRASLVATADGSPIPALHEARLVSWTESMKQDCGEDAVPADAYLFPDGLTHQPKQDFRALPSPARLRIPVRKKNGWFTTVGLGLNVGKITTPVTVDVEIPGHGKHPLKIEGGTAWFPVTIPGQAQEWAGSIEVELSMDTEKPFNVRRVHSLMSQQKLDFSFGDDAVGVVLTGKLAPRVLGLGPHAWSMTVNGDRQRMGTCMAAPNGPANKFTHAFSRSVGDVVDLQFQGSGLIQADWLPVKTHVTIVPRTAEAALIRDGLYPVESSEQGPFCWTRGRTPVLVPVTPGQHRYVARLHVGDTKPGPKRELTATFAGQTRSIQLSGRQQEVEWSWDDVTVVEAGLEDLTLQVETWSPMKHGAGSRDHRELGVQLYSLDWRSE